LAREEEREGVNIGLSICRLRKAILFGVIAMTSQPSAPAL
jgi:hypothetical protein